MDDRSRFLVVWPDGRQFGPQSLEAIVQWAREGRIPTAATLVPVDGGSPSIPVLAVPRLAAVIAAPPTVAGALAAPEDDGVSAMIPYRNGHALAAYYVGVMSLLPILGILLAPIAILQGVRGVRDYRETPKIKGVVHAWIGIVLGTLGLLISGLIIFSILFAMAVGQ